MPKRASSTFPIFFSYCRCLRRHRCQGRRILGSQTEAFFGSPQSIAGRGPGAFLAQGKAAAVEGVCRPRARRSRELESRSAATTAAAVACWGQAPAPRPFRRRRLLTGGPTRRRARTTPANGGRNRSNKPSNIESAQSSNGVLSKMLIDWWGRGRADFRSHGMSGVAKSNACKAVRDVSDILVGGEPSRRYRLIASRVPPRFVFRECVLPVPYFVQYYRNGA